MIHDPTLKALLAAAGAEDISTLIKQTRLQRTGASEAEAFGFRSAMSSDGNTLAISAVYANGSSGRVYIFTRSAGVWTQEAIIAPGELVGLDYFGYNIALSANGGNTLAVGAYGRDEGFLNTGAVYVFTRSAGVWTQTAKLTASDRATSDQLGNGAMAVSLSDDGTVVAAGAPNNDNTYNDVGSVYVWRLSGGSWVQDAPIYPPVRQGYATGTSAMRMGWSVALSGDATRLFTGALSWDDTPNGHTDAGQVVVFRWNSGTSAWDVEATLVSTTAFTSFGVGVGTNAAGTRLIVGADANDEGATNAGRAYVYTRDGTTWTLEGTLVPSDPQYGGYVGTVVSMNDAGTRAVLSGWNTDAQGVEDSGQLYIFEKVSGVWTEVASLSQPVPEDAANYGYAYLSRDGLTVVSGAPLEDSFGGSDSGAVYVYTNSGFDTNWATQARLEPTVPSAGSGMGYSTAMSADGSTLAAGSWKDSATGGSVQIFARNGEAWMQQASIPNPTPAANDYFGRSVALSADGNILVVGAYQDDTTASNAGAVYVFTRDITNTWALAQTITPIAVANDYVGNSVAISAAGNVILIGAYGNDTGASATGNAYVYERAPGASSWTLTATLAPTDPIVNGYFGFSCAISDDGLTLAVGAYNTTTSSLTTAGAVYVYRRTAATSPFWTLMQRVTPADIAAADLVGYSIALDASGTTLAVSSHGDDDKGSSSGSVYVFTRAYGGSAFTLQTKLTGGFALANDYFGFSLDLSDDGNTLAVGAYGDDDKGSASGSVYVFVRVNNGWSQLVMLTAADGVAADQLGWCVAVSGDGKYVAAGAHLDDNSAGAHLDDNSAGVDAGSVYVFDVSSLVLSGGLPTGFSQLSTLVPAGLVASAQAGRAVAVSGDGTRMAVGAPQQTVSGAANRGIVAIYKYSAGTWVLEATVTPTSPAAGDRFGTSVSLSYDGSALVVGAPGRSSGAGTAFVFSRTGTAWAQTKQLVPAGTASGPGDAFGTSVAISPSGNRAVVGAPYNDPSNVSNAGAVYVFSSASQWETASVKIVPTTLVVDGNFGMSVALNTAGDRIVAGEPGVTVGTYARAGQARVYDLLGSSWVAAGVMTRSVPENANEAMGSSVAISPEGQLVAAGAPGAKASGATCGMAVVYRLSAGTSWVREGELYSTSAVDSDQLGAAVAIPSGEDTVIVGVPGAQIQVDTGAAFVFTFDTNIWREHSVVTSRSSAANDGFGTSLSVSSNGRTLAVGAPLVDPSDSGAAYVFTRPVSYEDQGVTYESIAYSSPLASGNDTFGSSSFSISPDGTWAVLGNPADDRPGFSDAGSVEVIYYDAGSTSWKSYQLINPPADIASGNFGFNVSMSADGLRFVTGLFRQTVSTRSQAGEAYVYERASTLEPFALAATLRHPTPTATDYFGYTCQMSDDGNVVAVSCHGDDDTGSGSGSILIFRRANGAWAYEATLTNAAIAAGDNMGSTSIALSGDGMWVAASLAGRDYPVGAATPDVSSCGGVALFSYNPATSTWGFNSIIEHPYAATSAASDGFGRYLTLDSNGSTLAVGSPYIDVGTTGVDQGQVYVFTRNVSTNVWTQQAVLDMPSGHGGDNFGMGVALSGDGNRLVVTAYQDDNTNGVNAGSAFLYVRSGGVWGRTLRFLASDGRSGDGLGRFAFITRDGSLAAVSAPNWDDRSRDAANCGRLYFYPL